MAFVRILPDHATSDAGSGRTHRTELTLKDPASVLRHQRLALLVSTFDTHPDLEQAELSFNGTRCVYRTLPGAEFPNNKTLDLTRGEGCAPLEGTPSGRLTLTVVLRNQARLVLWTHVVSTARIANETIFVDPSPEELGGEVFVPSGRLTDEGDDATRRRRIDLLAYTWQVASSAWWIWLATGLGTLAISLGFIGLLSPPLALNETGAVVRGSAAFVLVAGLGLLYSVFTPPFQAPDEPHHFVAFTEVAGRPELIPQADAWAALAHAGRLRFRPAEQFTPFDVGNPDRVWEKLSAPDSSVRGGGVHVLWKTVAPLLHSMPAPRVFLALRVIHVLVLSILIGLCVALVARHGQVPSPHLLAFPVLLVPTLPFFGMHVSNHAPVIGAYVLMAGGLTLVLLNRKSDYVSGLMAGIGWALAIALSRSAIPLAPLIGAVATARLVFGPAPGTFLPATVFWAGLIGPMVILLSSNSMATYVATNTRLGAGMLPGGIQTLVEGFTRATWLIGLIVPLLAAVECGLYRLRQHSGHRFHSAARVVTRWTAVGAATAVALLMIGSIFLRYPVLATIDPLNRPPALEHTRDALWAGLTMLRFSAPDYRTSVTFWGGFGWLETLPSDWFVSLLTGGTGLALIGLLIYAARRADTRRMFFLGVALAGFAAGLAAYALSLSQVEVAIDLGGRYLFGLYLSLVLICWSGMALIPNGSSAGRVQTAVSTACVVACTGVHVYCLRLLLYRYF